MKDLSSAAVLAETRERLLRVTEQDRGLWGVMTAPQMLKHLSCACEVVLGERMVGVAKTPLPPKVMKFLALRVPRKWPHNVKASKELQRPVMEMTSYDFEELRQQALERVERLARATQLASAHPMFGPMTLKDWQRWGYLHTDHHLRQFGR